MTCFLVCLGSKGRHLPQRLSKATRIFCLVPMHSPVLGSVGFDLLVLGLGWRPEAARSVQNEKNMKDSAVILPVQLTIAQGSHQRSYLQQFPSRVVCITPDCSHARACFHGAFGGPQNALLSLPEGPKEQLQQSTTSGTHFGTHLEAGS